MGDPRLELDGEHVNARLLPDRGTKGGYTLVVEGTTQSHVNPRDPLDLQLEYTRFVAAIIDGWREAGRPLRVLHLGAGALTIARYVAATRPGSVQHVVELHRELLEFVLDVLPLDPDAELTVEFDDARAAVERSVRTAGGYDLAIVDVFSGSSSPEHLTTLEFFDHLGHLLAPDGLIVVNTIASPGLGRSREVGATLAALRSDVVVVSAPEVVAGKSLGNLVFAAADVPLPTGEFTRRADGGPRRIEILSGAKFLAFVGDAPVRRDTGRGD
ncbi:spermidine synthase [Agromyces ramosus]|uniref:Spermidine synthase n=1 Tax=Agromyces ramosus TaxID=33879 RepID=A0ABU0R3J2_9MICO|nr:fused MFS/spermidine synthase [Agromyces ramosus]MDQ0892649.1 spermidine synthase [Agromyces ramosus]